MSYKIESGVEMPVESFLKRCKNWKQGTKIRKYPFDEMKIGDMFHFNVHERHKVRSAASAETRRSGKKFATRMFNETECGCWRIEGDEEFTMEMIGSDF